MNPFFNIIIDTPAFLYRSDNGGKIVVRKDQGRLLPSPHPSRCAPWRSRYLRISAPVHHLLRPLSWPPPRHGPEKLLTIRTLCSGETRAKTV